jgi:prolyl-tRNA synthetase
MSDEKLPSQSDNFSEWYNQIVLRAELADYAPCAAAWSCGPTAGRCGRTSSRRSTGALRPPGTSTRPSRCSSPCPSLQKEKEHVEGFSPELAVVTIGGGELLEEPLVVRPTSETIIGEMYSALGQIVPRPAHPDQPVGQRGALGNAHAHVPAHAEFYWQEGHTAHATSQEAVEETLRMLDTYTTSPSTKRLCR